MATPTFLTATYGPIVEFVRECKGHVRKKGDRYTGIAFVNAENDMLVAAFDYMYLAREFVIDSEGNPEAALAEAEAMDAGN